MFAELKGPVKDKLARIGPETRIATAVHYPTLTSAVEACRQAPGTP